MAKKQKQRSKREQRSIRTQQIIFIAIGVIVILSMVLTLVVK